MSAFGLLEIQKAIYAKLIADTALTGMVSGVFDRVKENTAYPYVALAEMDAQDWSTQTTQGLQSTVTLEVFSRGGGRKECLTILERMHMVLHDASLTMTGHRLVQIRFVRGTTQLLADGLTTRGDIEFQLFTHHQE